MSTLYVSHLKCHNSEGKYYYNFRFTKKETEAQECTQALE